LLEWNAKNRLQFLGSLPSARAKSTRQRSFFFKKKGKKIFCQVSGLWTLGKEFFLKKRKILCRVLGLRALGKDFFKKKKEKKLCRVLEQGTLGKAVFLKEKYFAEC